MSENQDDLPVKIHKIEIDRSPELEAKQTEIDNLKSENEELRSALETVAEKELAVAVEKYGIDKNLSEEQKIALVRAKKQEQADSQSTKALFGNMNVKEGSDIVVNDDTGYDSIQEMVSDLNKKSRREDEPTEKAVADSILTELNKKILNDIKTGSRQSFSTEIDPKELSKLRNQSKLERLEEMKRISKKRE